MRILKKIYRFFEKAWLLALGLIAITIGEMIRSDIQWTWLFLPVSYLVFTVYNNLTKPND
jgi:hypothetical protein|tara:strand:+ start:4617 stop:4796 length:180 start_codon:yes stop_codon:yes gene_type:complete